MNLLSTQNISITNANSSKSYVLTLIFINSILIGFNNRSANCALINSFQSELLKFSSNDVHINNIDTNQLELETPIFEMTELKPANICAFESFLYSLMIDQSLCKYFLTTEFKLNTKISASLANFLKESYNNIKVAYNINSLYEIFLTEIAKSVLGRNSSYFSIIEYNCFQKLTKEIYELIDMENKILLRNGKTTYRVQNHMHEHNMQNIEKNNHLSDIIKQITDGISIHGDKFVKNYFNSCKYLRIFIDRCSISGIGANSVFPKCFKKDNFIFIFRHAVNIQKAEDKKSVKHCTNLFYDYKNNYFYTIDYSIKKLITNEQGLNYLFMRSVFVTYERI